jgi:NAD+ synthase (glutamine-hydrolysing)
MRHFTPWQRPREVEDYYLEQIVGKITGQYKVPFGDAVISTRDTCLGLETCEELFTPNGYVPGVSLGLNADVLTSPSSPHIPYSLAGIFALTNCYLL